MNDICPTVGFSCVNQLRARVQAVMDQMTGFKELLEVENIKLDQDALLEHVGKLGTLLEETLKDYAEGHGPIPLQDDVESVRWLLYALR